ncbi:MAG: DUF1566 domain-containing protein [Thermodesulfobacteriota bacterium]
MKQLKRIFVLGCAVLLSNATIGKANTLESMALTIFEAAEATFPQYFPPGEGTDSYVREDLLYDMDSGHYQISRHYATPSGTTVLDVDIDEGAVYMTGGDFGSTRQRIGTVEEIQAMLGISTISVDELLDNGDGTITDTTTDLTWKRCSEGQTWTGSTCAGEASTYTYDQANAVAVSFAGYTDWRLPNARELQTLAKRRQHLPAINTDAFPNTPSFSFWASTVVALSPEVAWLVHFSNGTGFYYALSYASHVRMVRGGASSALMSESRPDADYTDNGDGTVTHTPTGLTWKRCSEGQTWSGTTCTGSATLMTFEQANLVDMSYAGHDDWRLPTHEELFSLVDFTQRYPAINGTIFPATPSDSGDSTYWSSSVAVDDTQRWTVWFRNGYTNSTAATTPSAVRLVRDGQSQAPTAWSSSTDCLFSWAEQTFPAYFPTSAGTSSLVVSGNDFSRYYQGTGTSLMNNGSDNNLYYTGPLTNNVETNLGAMADWLSLAGCQ